MEAGVNTYVELKRLAGDREEWKTKAYVVNQPNGRTLKKKKYCLM